MREASPGEVSPTLAIRAKQAIDDDGKVGVQIGDPIGESRPPRVYLLIDEYPNGGVTSAVIHMFESGGISEAYEYPEPSGYEDDVGPEAKAAQMIQQHLDFPDEADTAVSTLHFAGSDELANAILSRLDLPDSVSTSINEVRNEYIP